MLLQVDVIGIDEAQFFDDLHDFCCKAADHDGKIVVVAGLDGDYKRYSLNDLSWNLFSFPMTWPFAESLYIP